MHLIDKEAEAVEVVTRRFAFRATGEAFVFLERNQWFVRWLFFAYALWLFRRPLRTLMGWAITHLPPAQRPSSSTKRENDS